MQSSGRVVAAKSKPGALHRSLSHIGQGRCYTTVSTTLVEADDGLESMDHSSHDQQQEQQQSRLWTPSIPIVFSTAEPSTRTMRSDFTWKRGDRIVFGPEAAHRRIYSTKAPSGRPASPSVPRYQPRAQRVLSPVTNPNDLSFLAPATPPPRPVRPTRPSLPASVGPVSAPSAPLNPSPPSTSSPDVSAIPVPSAQVSKSDETVPQMTKEISLVNSNGNVNELEQASKSDQPLALTTIEEPTAIANDAVSELEKANSLLKDELAAIHARLETQENDHAKTLNHITESKKHLVDDKVRAMSKTQSALKEVMALRKKIVALEKTNTQLQKDLEEERAPYPSLLRRLSRNQDAKREQEDRTRRQEKYDRRVAKRAAYSDFQEFFYAGTKDVRSWLLNHVETQNGLNKRTAIYWQDATRKFDAFIHRFHAMQGLPGNDADSTALHKRRTAILDLLTNHLRLESDKSRDSLLEYEHQVFEFDAVFWAELRAQSHTIRHTVKTLRHYQDRPPGIVSQRRFGDVLASRASTPLKTTFDAVSSDYKRVKRAIETENSGNRDRIFYLQRRKAALSMQMDLIWLARNFAIAHDELVQADWLTHQPLANAAILSTTRPLIAVNEELRRQFENGVQDFMDANLSHKRDILRQRDIFDSRDAVNELEDVVYRNVLLADRYGKLEKTEATGLRDFTLQNYAQKMHTLDELLSTAKRHSVRGWIQRVYRGRRKESQDTLVGLDDPNPFGLLASAAPTKASIKRKKERAALARKLQHETPKSERSPSQESADAAASTTEEVTPESTQDVVTDNTEGFSFDSPMDAFEEPSPNDTEAETDPKVTEVTKTESVGTEWALPKPMYKLSRQPERDSLHRTSSAIQPRKGVLPKPDYGGRQRRRPIFKPTRPRRAAFPSSSSDIFDQSGLAHEDHNSESIPSDSNSISSASAFPETSTDSQDPPAPQEQHIPLRFQIPQQALRNAFLASKNSGAAFWKHSLYRGPADERITIHYCTKFDQAEKQARLFLNEPVIGFDAEWEPNTKIHSGSIKENMSLIQIACEDRIALFQIAAFYGETPEDLMPPSLRAILESPNIIKTGVNIAGDFSRLRKCFEIQGQGLFELSHLYKLVKYSATDPFKVDRKPAGLANQVQEILYLPLSKGAVRTSAWSKRLSPEQIEYAATDAYAGYRLFDALEAKRKAMIPTPPRPALYELGQPIILGNGKPPPKLPPKKKRIAKAGTELIAAIEEEEAPIEQDEEIQDAEDVDEAQAEADELSEADDQFYSCESDYEETTDAQSPIIRQASPRIEDPPPRAAMVSAELGEAERWLAQWRSGLPTNHKPRTNPACLRAYALWHVQALEIKDVAKILRTPPLARNSVAQYVLEAIKQENLPFEPERAREALKLLHVSAQWRYARIVKMLEDMKRA